MDGKLEQIKYKGIERNSAEESASIGSAQELFNMRYKDGAWRNVKRKLRLGNFEAGRTKYIGWYSHPSVDNQTFIAYNEDARKVAVINYVTNIRLWIVKRDGTDFVLPATETFNRFGYLENVLILFSNVQMYRFLWTNGKFEYVEFGDIEWTLSKSKVYATTLSSETAAGVIANYVELRNNRSKIGYIDGACAFRLAIELYDGSFVFYSDIRILYGTNKINFMNTDAANNPGFSQSTCYRPVLYEDTNSPTPSKPFFISEYTDYHPIIDYTIPEWLTYYVELNVIKALHVCAIKPRFPYIPNEDGWEFRTSISGFRYFHIKPSELSDTSNVLFLNETDVFYSIFKTSLGSLRPPSATESFNFLDFETNKEIPPDNFTSNKTTALYNFNYNGRLHLEQITNTLPSPLVLETGYYEDLSFPTALAKALSFRTTPPPISERYVGETYVVDRDGGGVGEWFGRQNQIAVWTGSFWTFTVPNFGDLVLIIDNSTYNAISAYSPFSPRNSYYCGLYQWAPGGDDFFPDHWRWMGLNGTETALSTPLTDYAITPDYEMYIEAVIATNQTKYVTRIKTEETYKLVKGFNNLIYCGRFAHFPNVAVSELRLSFSKDGENFYKLKNPTHRLSMRPVSALNIAQSILQIDEDPNFRVAKLSDWANYEYFNTGYQWAELLYLKLSIPPAGTDYETSPLCELVTEMEGTYTDTNRLQLSELENPFVLPASSSYRFGDINNRINGIEVPRGQLTETRFGQFPLYVCTTQGIWVLEQGTDVLYSNMYYLDKYVCNNNNLIKSIQGFVCFSTAEGLYLVSGKSFQELSTSLEGDVDCHIPILNLEALQSFFLDRPDYNLYLSQSEIKQDLLSMSMCFDYINKEIIFSPTLLANTWKTKEINYSYVYSIESKSWHKISENFAYFVDTNPAVVGIKCRRTLGEKQEYTYEYTFFDMHAEDVSNDAKMYISRPVTFNSMEYKRLEQILIRANLKNIKNSQVGSPIYAYVFGSLDGKEYKLIQGGETSSSYINDISLRRCFTDCKFFIFAYVCTHDIVEFIKMEVVVKPKFVKTLR